MFGHPPAAVFIVEMADTTLRLDRTLKAGVYASSGVAEYWILNLADRVLELHRDPAAVAEQPFGHHYRSIARHAETETVKPLAAPAKSIRVSALLPRAVAG